uniref:Uncharacterized protein n=1 Tax=Tetraselmis sp. GSL018 TaxID=582737 RepID=A0A061S1Y0_9CHLO
MRIDTAPTTPAGWSVTSYDRPQDALAVQQPAIAVHPGRPPPAGFGARSPSRERRSSSKPSTPQEALELSTVSARISPSPRHLTPSKARPGAEQTAERVRERKRSEEASRLRSGSPNAPSLEPSQISVLSSELSRKGVYRHDGGELESSGLPRGIKQMTEAEMSEYGPAGVKRQTLRPPPPPKPTIGQLRRAKSSGPARRQSPPRALARRDGQAAGQQPVVVARPRFEVPVEPSSAVLDGFMILEAACAELPEEVETVCLSGRSIHAVEEADLPHFSMLREADASDNLLPGMGALAGLPALRYLRLSANGLGRLELAAGTFESLQELDLSFNRLEAGEALEPLSELPALRKLDLTGNSMPSLPGVVSGFTALEELCLACNGLRGGALLALQRLPSLRALSVQDNVISKLPAWTEARPFPELLELNLTNNHVGSASALVPLEELPSIQRVRLAGNPLSAKASMAAKKAARAKESEFRAAGVTNLIADAAIGHGETPKGRPGRVRCPGHGGLVWGPSAPEEQDQG